MTAKSDWLETAVLNHFLRNSAQSAVSPYVGLFTAAPGEAGGGTEVSGPVGTTGYERKAPGFGAPSGGAVSNASQITWGPALTSWGTITSFGIFDAASGGNLLYYGNLTSSKVVGIDDLFVILAGDLQVAEL